MRKLFLVLFTIIIAISCSKSNSRYYNPYLPAVKVNFSLYLPTANDLVRPGGTYIAPFHGIMGIIIYNTGRKNVDGTNEYVAYDLACPNHKIDPTCSKLIQKKSNDLFVYCQCKGQHNNVEAQYDVILGQSNTPGIQYSLKPYPVTVSADYLYIKY